MSCNQLFQVLGCNFTLLCPSNKTVECDAVWTFDPPTWTNACIPPPGTPSNGVMVAVVSTVTNGTCPKIITQKRPLIPTNWIASISNHFGGSPSPIDDRRLR